MTDDLPVRLARRLQEPAPADRVRARFAPSLSFGRHFGPPMPDSRPAAVVALLYPKDGKWSVPLTVRPASLPAHGGQISLPGGLVEPGEDTQTAALRELEEELGIPADGIAVLGKLSPLNVFVTRFWVTPWVATATKPPVFHPNPAEVDVVIEAPLDCLAAGDNHGVRQRRHGPLRFQAPYIKLGEHEVWGATSMILAELVSLAADESS